MDDWAEGVSAATAVTVVTPSETEQVDAGTGRDFRPGVVSSLSQQR